MKGLCIVGVVSVALLGSGWQGKAAETPKEKPVEGAKAEKKSRQIPFRGKIGSVDKAAMTLTLEGKEKNRTFRITSETKIAKDGKPAVFGDLAVGETVGGSYREASGKMEVLTLNVGANPKAPQKEKKQ